VRFVPEYWDLCSFQNKYMQTLDQLVSGQLAGATTLKLSCGLREVPVQVLSLADTLEILDLSGNDIDYLPEEFPALKNLKILFLSNNRFTEFPAVLGKCSKLEMIGFKANQITLVPEGSLPVTLAHPYR
jgi:Leucine-rich repeat (LRR) protein